MTAREPFKVVEMWCDGSVDGAGAIIYYLFSVLIEVNGEQRHCEDVGESAMKALKNALGKLLPETASMEAKEVKFYPLAASCKSRVVVIYDNHGHREVSEGEGESSDPSFAQALALVAALKVALKKRASQRELALQT